MIGATAMSATRVGLAPEKAASLPLPNPLRHPAGYIFPFLSRNAKTGKISGLSPEKSR